MARCKDCFHWDACKKMLESFTGHCIPSDYEGGADRCEDFVSATSVAPRAEVAREIFEEIDKRLDDIIVVASPNDCFITTFRKTMEKVTAEVDELKKKYTEGEK